MTPRPANLFVCGLNESNPCLKFPSWTGPMTLLCIWTALPVLICCSIFGLCKFPGALASLFNQARSEANTEWARLFSSLAWARAGQVAGHAKSLVWGPKSGRLLTLEFPHQSVPLSWLCKWANLPFENATWMLQVGILFAKIQVLAVSSTYSLLHHNSTPNGQASGATDSPPIPVE